jgi:hypothetical protein
MGIKAGVHDDELRRFEADGAAPLPAQTIKATSNTRELRIWYSTYAPGSLVILLPGALLVVVAALDADRGSAGRWFAVLGTKGSSNDLN